MYYLVAAIYVVVCLVLMLVVVIGGRIVAAFTGNALRRLGSEVAPVTRGWLEIISIGSVGLIVLCDLIRPDSRAAGILAGIAAVAHTARLAGWRSFRMHREPILWVLHVAYAWVPIGLALDGNGNILVVDNGGLIRKILLSGQVETWAGSRTGKSEDGPLLNAAFDKPTGIAIAPDGAVFVLEPNEPRVRKISAGRFITVHKGLP